MLVSSMYGFVQRVSLFPGSDTVTDTNLLIAARVAYICRRPDSSFHALGLVAIICHRVAGQSVLRSSGSSFHGSSHARALTSFVGD